ncbi:hypothetical protein SGCZBJ_12670 [Caulobacter zeae]|uniref:Lipoprotein n=1 Tax=Caulobacter zeae TaxID=2055137 RepID=A0A2N5DGA1_9CAUL|nr:hypothetical protein [Caulobacter zeae]PLR25082.1 hypothetical protein SGCZBJ_12670 [Caulobacter zeae]
MRKTIVLGVIAIACVASGCATKRYPIATGLGAAEASALSCREIDLELIRADEVRKQITDTAKTDWRSVAGFLGDYGIGNAMAKADAEKAINNRVVALNNAKATKRCGAESASLPAMIGQFFGDVFSGE